jgi:hypothetical protein
MRLVTSRSMLLLLAGAVVGCSGGSTGPAGTGRVNFQIATLGVGSSNGPMAADVVVTKGTSTIVINQVQLVARKIRLQQSNGRCEEDADQDDGPIATAASGAGQAHEEEDEDDDEDCPVLKLGPLLLSPPLTDGAVTSFTADVPVGTYTELRIQIHKPRGNRDQAFLAANPEFTNVSIRVKGTFNGAPFTFDTGIEEEEEIEFEKPLEVTIAGTTSLTLFLDVRGWFLNQGGTALLDPTAPSTTIRDLIERNIRSSFRAFRDNDRDGEDDEHEGR